MSRLSKLLEAAKTAPKRATRVWQPEKGEGIAGTVTRMRRIPGKQIDPDTGQRIRYLSLILAEESGELSVVNCGMLLEEEMVERQVEVGDEVAIVFHGSEGTAGGNDVGIYSMAHEPCPRPAASAPPRTTAKLK